MLHANEDVNLKACVERTVLCVFISNYPSKNSGQSHVINVLSKTFENVRHLLNTRINRKYKQKAD